VVVHGGAVQNLHHHFDVLRGEEPEVAGIRGHGLGASHAGAALEIAPLEVDLEPLILEAEPVLGGRTSGRDRRRQEHRPDHQAEKGTAGRTMELGDSGGWSSWSFPGICAGQGKPSYRRLTV
jgi:hypothetical protein